ncbi:MAG: DUF4299 domain-containing protein [Roseburia sp.]|nr:DUF4299 domain-containing protein [Roseburia sp.]
MYCIEEERTFTSGELEENIDKFVEFSLASLTDFCNHKEYQKYIFTLALWPYTLPEDKVLCWRDCTDLEDFEQTLHVIQSQDVYYAKPQLLQKNGTAEIGAFYVLTEECESVFPICADGFFCAEEFLNLNELKISEGFIQFYIYSEDRMLDGLYPYEKFMKEIRQCGIQQFDADHVLIPPMNKESLERLADKLS